MNLAGVALAVMVLAGAWLLLNGISDVTNGDVGMGRLVAGLALLVAAVIGFGWL